jgi:hypothetical protein
VAWARSHFEQCFSGDIAHLKKCLETLTSVRALFPTDAAADGGDGDEQHGTALARLQAALRGGLEQLAWPPEDLARATAAFTPAPRPPADGIHGTADAADAADTADADAAAAQSTPAAAVQWALELFDATYRRAPLALLQVQYTHFEARICSLSRLLSTLRPYPGSYLGPI